MKNIKNIAVGMTATALLAAVLVMSPALARAEDSKKGDNSLFLSSQASIKSSIMANFESASGVFLGSNGEIRVLGAKVSSVSDNHITATSAFGNSSLSYTINVDANTKINGKSQTNSNAPVITSLKAGDSVSFAGTLASSTSSSIVVNAKQVVSRALIGTKPVDNSKTNFQGEVNAVNASDNSFTLAYGNRTIKVALASGAAVTIDGSTKAISDLTVGEKVKIAGTLNSDSTVITATKISADSTVHGDDGRGNQGKGDDGQGENKGGLWNRIKSWFGR